MGTPPGSIQSTTEPVKEQSSGKTPEEQIRVEANRLLYKEYHLENDINDYTVKYILMAMENLGWKIRRRVVNKEV